MKAFHLFALFVLGLLLALNPISSVVQADGMYTACEQPASETLPWTTTKVDFNAACDTYRQCIAENDYLEPSCQMHAAVTLLASCQASQQVCRQAAFLYAEMILVFSDCESLCDRGVGAQQQALHTLLDGLVAYDVHNFPTALAYFSGQSYSMNQGTLAFARAIVHWSAGNVEAALAELDVAVQRLYGRPSVQLVQAELQAAVGYTELASLLTEQVWRRLPEAEFDTLFGSMTSDYPFSEAIWETWRWFPVRVSTISPGGDYRADFSREPARTIRVGFSNDRQHMIVEGLFEDDERCGTAFPCLPFIILTGSHDHYGLVMSPDVGDGEHSVYFTRTSDYYTGVRRAGGYEWHGSQEFMIAPLSVPDPRLNLTGIRCGVFSRLQFGMSDVQRVYIGNERSFPVFDQLGGREIDQVEFETPLTIVGEGVCQDETMWWPVRSEQASGWIAENDGTRYLFYSESTG